MRSYIHIHIHISIYMYMGIKQSPALLDMGLKQAF